MDKRKLFNEINNILMAWNPIGVEGPALSDEYLRYIPRIVELKQNPDQLDRYLKDLLVELGMEYDPSNMDQNSEFDNLSKKIREL